MTEQEKQELARQLKDNIDDLSTYLAAHPNSMDACDVRWRIKVGSIALASLTAQSVKLPKIKHPAQFDYADEVVAVLKSHGYEAEE